MALINRVTTRFASSLDQRDYANIVEASGYFNRGSRIESWRAAWQLTRRKRDYREFNVLIDRNIVCQNTSAVLIVRVAFKVVRSRDDEALMGKMGTHRKMNDGK